MEALATSILVGVLVGMFWGFCLGLMTAIFSRDGVWPQVWSGMMICGGVGGAILGAIDWAVQ